MKGFLIKEHCNNCITQNFFYKYLSEELKEKFSFEKKEIKYNKGESIIKQGTFITHIVYLKSGLVKLLVEGMNDKNIIVRFLPSGSFIGLPMIAQEESYPFTAIALKNSVVCHFKTDLLSELFNNNEKLQKELYNWYADDYRYNFNKFAIIGTKQMHGRLAEALLYFSQDRLMSENIFKYITRKDIAELAGMSQESTTKILNELKNDKILKIQGKKIEIIDYKMIERLSRLG